MSDDRNGLQLISEEAVATSKLLRGRSEMIDEVDGLLADEELFESESHSAARGEGD